MSKEFRWHSSVSRVIPLALAGLLSAIGTHGQGSGVLIGLEEARAEEAQEFDSIHEPRYQTLWVARDANGKLSVLAAVPELIVPRRDGFWHVGVKQVCEFDPGVGDDGGNESISQIVWAAVTERAEIWQIQPCTAHKLEDYAPPYGRSEEDRKKNDAENSSTACGNREVQRRPNTGPNRQTRSLPGEFPKSRKRLAARAEKRFEERGTANRP